MAIGIATVTTDGEMVNGGARGMTGELWVDKDDAKVGDPATKSCGNISIG